MNFGLQDKKVILGVCGGIAAYKSVELLRLLRKADAHVRVVLTENAQWFVGPGTFQALSGQSVCTSIFEQGDDAAIRHIDWAQAADVVVIAPATANMIGKLANGIADDALSTFMMAVTSPVLICPSMNTHMYESRAVQRNLERLRSDGYFILEPVSGKLACGTTGPGRLPEASLIFDYIAGFFIPKDFKNRRVLVTAGPTQEPIDPVRFISNPSSGKMGYALAKAAAQRGAEVILVSGPTSLPDPYGIEVVKTRTAAEMAHAVFERMEGVAVIIKAAAVSDYRPKVQAAQKIKKNQEEMVLVLEKSQDILRELGRRKRNQILVGFAAETEDLEKNAHSKLDAKNLDMIVGNIVGDPGSGFGSDMNKVTFFFRDGGKESLAAMEKERLAHILLDRVRERIMGGTIGELGGTEGISTP
jgi:phosphopantothenoylcysteine decarboxylase/phosphopantothenate--cysteine ligase